jgi:hypothetical protein
VWCNHWHNHPSCQGAERSKQCSTTTTTDPATTPAKALAGDYRHPPHAKGLALWTSTIFRGVSGASADLSKSRLGGSYYKATFVFGVKNIEKVAFIHFSFVTARNRSSTALQLKMPVHFARRVLEGVA